MPARLQLDDAVQTYTDDEVIFLLHLCDGLPEGTILRASPRGNRRTRPLLVALDLRLTGRLFVRGSTRDEYAKSTLLRFNTLLRVKAKRALEEIDKPPRVGILHPCPSCGRDMVEVPDGKRRHGAHLCPACDQGKWDPATEAVLFDARKGLGRFSKGAGWH